MTQIEIEFIRGFVTLFALVAGSYVALRMYFRQKEYELVKQRYLEGAVDTIASGLEDAFGVVSHNYARCLQIVKSFRDCGEHFDLKELDRAFLELKSANFHQIAHHRLEVLVGSKAFWIACQSALAYCTSANGQIIEEFTQAMRLRHSSDLIEKSFAEMANAMADDLKGLHERGFRFASIIAELHFLSRLLEVEKMNMASVSKFPERSDIKTMLSRVKKEFPESTDPAL